MAVGEVVFDVSDGRTATQQITAPSSILWHYMPVCQPFAVHGKLDPAEIDVEFLRSGIAAQSPLAQIPLNGVPHPVSSIPPSFAQDGPVVRRCAGWLLLVVTLFVLGCDDPPAPLPDPEPPTAGGERFDPAQTGTVSGQVLWHGSPPVVAPFRSIPEPLTDQIPPPPRNWPNPNAPSIDAESSALAGAVVWLDGVDPTAGRPWNLSPVRVEARGQQFHILQGGADRRVAFVRARDTIELVSRDSLFHAVQIRGFGGSGKSVFLTCMLPDPNKVVSRRVEGPEVAELTSAAGYFWMRSYLFVSAHPYFAYTDEQGRFTLKDVPAGTYEVVAWHPDWRISATERNPDSMRVKQVRFGPPLTSRESVTVRSGKTAQLQLSLSVVR